MEVIPTLFEELLDGGRQEMALCKEVLFGPDCGALCELQAIPLILSNEVVQPLHACSLAAACGVLVRFDLSSNDRQKYHTGYSQYPGYKCACRVVSADLLAGTFLHGTYAIVL